MTSWNGLNTAYFTEDKDDHIYNALVKSIVEHQLLPGSKLPEEALAEVFSVSRTGIRRVLQRLAAVQLVTLLPKRGAHVTTPDAEESRDVFATRKILECANLPLVIAHCQSPHLVALKKLVQEEKRAHDERNGAAAIRLSAAFHVQLQAISGNKVLTESVSQLTLRSSLAIAAWGAPWQQGCRCHDHDDLIELLKKRDVAGLTASMAHHFDSIVASLHFEQHSGQIPDFAQIFATHKPVTGKESG
ncbi:GntR family transcriptional regulator [Rahnella sp. C60]|uniref:GntR family transcriptional regulator n=1 Tax=Rahnella perminowiae TaxID=2816244 RepID=A0ABS6KY43_9GAMM|nr:GntR family transcriptional regulator [Rahnella perminowiae]MBU9812612.1 GntR family transcriptional regulator [Rahnella perminowiae]MBU9814346.1 GntR family transcriptional regulator [Rahnella perminowiae]MBU9834516.1 GntR family transcriptional regulator [Rahnella perminowiae]MCX2944754.1 GntR family transcriptional regulator [Rahnella perminowiae]